jgi:M6 family metalloprotease-like protein
MSMKKNALLIFAFLIIHTVIRADYFDKLPYTVKQPDGITINCFVSGDEFFNWIHDLEGYTIIQAPDGYYYYAEQDGDLVKPSVYKVNSINPADVGLTKWVKISKKEYQRRYDEMFSYKKDGKGGPLNAPQSGSFNNLVVYIRFLDDTEFITARQSFDDKLNPATGVALKSYFQEVSYNALTIGSTHYPECALTTNLSYQDTHLRSYFQPYNATTNPTGYNGTTERTTREHTLLVNAITWINANSPVPGSLNIDGDNDSYVDNVCFVIKGSNGAWADLLWAHRWALYSQTVTINGKRVFDYTFQPETQVSVKTLCHEMFHSLGAPDLYHYVNQGVISPAGTWDIMDGGGGYMLAYMKWKYSNHTWIPTIPEITATGTYSLNPLTSSTNNCYKIASPNSTSEYFMVEYRNKSGTFEVNVPGSGLIVYRIDTRVTGNSNGPPDEVYVYRPGGTTTANGTPNNAFFSSAIGRTAINDITDPSSYLQNGSSGGLNISNVTAAGTTISFDVTMPSPCTPPTAQSSAYTSSAITNTSMTVGWTRGSGDALLVVARADNAVNADPVNGINYTADAAFGNGTQTGISNYVVYKGTGTSVNLTGLNPGTTYHYAVYEYNSADFCYKKTPLTGNAKTTGIAPYCTVNLGGTGICPGDISALSITGTTLNNTTHTNCSTANSSTYSSYSPSGSNTCDLTKGSTYTINITTTSADIVSLWIDYNQNGIFEATEWTQVSTSTVAGTPSSISFSVPPGAITGQTGLRVRSRYAGNQNGAADACMRMGSGITEDYTINIVPLVCTVTAPSVGQITQPSCSLATGSVVLSGLPATGTWTLTRTPGGTTSTGSGVSSTISGLAAGTYTYTVTNASGCISVVSANVVINTQPVIPTAPSVGTITQPTCSVTTGSAVLSGLPATGTWTLTRTPGGTTSTGSGVSSTISGLAAGTYTYTVTNASGCISVASANVVINTQPVTPGIPSISLNINILHSSSTIGNQWYNQSGLISGATNQDYTVSSNDIYYVIVTIAGCSSNPSNSINVVLTGDDEFVKNNKRIMVYPNPVSHQLIIEIEGGTDKTGFEIINSNGQIVFKGSLYEKTVVQTTDFSPGIYLIKIANGKTFEFKKIVK